MSITKRKERRVAVPNGFVGTIVGKGSKRLRDRILFASEDENMRNDRPLIKETLSGQYIHPQRVYLASIRRSVVEVYTGGLATFKVWINETFL